LLYDGVKVVELDLVDIDGTGEAVTIEEQADETRNGIPDHCDTNVGRPVEAVWKVMVYVAQKFVTGGVCEN
jgi:hypothetical protein